MQEKWAHKGASWNIYTNIFAVSFCFETVLLCFGKQLLLSLFLTLVTILFAYFLLVWLCWSGFGCPRSQVQSSVVRILVLRSSWTCWLSQWSVHSDAFQLYHHPVNASFATSAGLKTSCSFTAPSGTGPARQGCGVWLIPQSHSSRQNNSPVKYPGQQSTDPVTDSQMRTHLPRKRGKSKGFLHCLQRPASSWHRHWITEFPTPLLCVCS